MWIVKVLRYSVCIFPLTTPLKSTETRIIFRIGDGRVISSWGPESYDYNGQNNSGDGLEAHLEVANRCLMRHA